MTAEMARVMEVGGVFPVIRRTIHPPIPIDPIMAATNGVHGPGSVKKSEITIMNAPHMKPAIGPYMNPEMNVNVSANPTLIRTPNIGVGATRARLSMPIRTTAPTAINTDVMVISFDRGFMSFTVYSV